MDDPQMDLLADLTPAQRQAVTHVDGPMLVLAGAGSGKTRVITRRVAHLIRQGVKGENILAITFTNKAAGEMRERTAKLVPDSGVVLGTFHSLCARLLRSYAPLVGLDRSFTIYDQADRLRVIKQAMAGLSLDGVSVTPERVDSVISKAKNDLIGPEALARRSDDHVAAVAALVYPEYQRVLRDSSAVDFDDLLVHTVKILKEHPEVRATLDRRFRYVLVDEYQDTNLAQYAIVRALSVDHPNICVTGDPDQSIYGWRGANLKNILEFEEDYPGCKVVKLERNYRSTKNILAAADCLIRHNRQRKPKELITENPHGAPVVLTIYPNETEEARDVASRVVEKVSDSEYTYGDIAVFCRVTALTRNLEQAFRAANIPYQVVGGMSFYERQEVKDVLAYLSLMVNPKDDIAFARVVNVPPRGIGATTMERLREHASTSGKPLLETARQAAEAPGLKDRAVVALREFCGLVDRLTSLRDQTAESVMRKVLAMTGYHSYLEDEGKEKGDDRRANIDELVSAAREFDREHPGASVVEFMEQVSLASAVDRMKDDTGAVTLMTLHAAKGLEFPVVFIVGIEQGLLPHSRANESRAETEEERRLFFVGITRAERELFLSYCTVREFRGTRQMTIPSQFLRELPEDVMEVRDVSGGMGIAGTPSWPSRVASSTPSFAPRPKPRPVAPAAPGGGGFRLTTAAALAGGSGGASGPPADLSVFRPGMMVVHPSYGIGRLTAVEGAGPDRKARVHFTVGGERVFVLAKSPLRPV
ncbi:MAG: UvrD-helicase domain-containing protein [Isosphaeraceae bacterium]